MTHFLQIRPLDTEREARYSSSTARAPASPIMTFGAEHVVRPAR